jgi:hypothetical protein
LQTAQLLAEGSLHDFDVLVGTLAPVGEKRKRDPMGPGQKIANKKFTAFILLISSQKDPANVQGIEAFKNASEQNKQVIGRRCEFSCGFVASLTMLLDEPL